MENINLLLTGASSNLGSAIAYALAEQGAKILLLGRDIEKLEALRKNLPREGHHIIGFDLAKIEALSSSLQSSINEFGNINMFIHAAGLSSPAALRLIKTQSINESFNINVLSAIEICRILTSNKVNKKSLRNVIFISSISAHRGCPGFSIYASAKSALASFSKTMSIELESKCTFTTLTLGPLQGGSTNLPDELCSSIATRWEVSPNDVAFFILNTILTASQIFNGQEIIIDHGLSNTLNVIKDKQ